MQHVVSDSSFNDFLTGALSALPPANFLAFSKAELDRVNEDLDLLEIVNSIKSTFNYSLQLRKKFREQIEDMEDMEEYDEDEWKKILKSYVKLKADVTDEIDGLDRADTGKEEIEEENDEDANKEDFWNFIYEFKHVLNEKDLEMVLKYVVKKRQKK